MANRGAGEGIPCALPAMLNIGMRHLITLIERACQTPGAIYDTTIADDSIGVTVTLPKQVQVGDLSDTDGQRYDDMIHDAMEKIVTKIIATTNADAPSLWAMARKADPENADDD